MDYKYDYSRKDLSKAKIELKFKVAAASIEKAKDKAYTKLAKNVDIKGFRPGKAPRNTVESTLGSRFFEEAINILLPDVAKDALDREQLMPIAPLEYDLTKYAQGDDLEFKAMVYVLPEFDLKKLDKIKVKKDKSEVTDKEIEKVIDNMFKEWQVKQNIDTDKGLVLAGEDKRKAKTAPKKESEEKPTDDWAKTLDLDVNNLQELRDKIKIELSLQKQYMTVQKYQYEILEEAMKLTDAEVPSTTVEHETEHRMEHFLEEVVRIGMTLEKYLQANKNTEEKIKK
jgi:FKBP-type peptidyl-prolyl cis-trans isomerase (trigger factor)